ncbi:MAG: DUF2007 domain-containing protein [Tannerella sp.]|jgi:hypothetical protein|nr:DUF2007 domain-containing protein [Tannerella sp.]
MEHLVEIANFAQAETAEILASLLRAEGIACTTRDEASSQVLRGAVDIGVRVEVMEHNVPRALELLKDSGLLQPEAEAEEDKNTDASAGLAGYVPALRKLAIILVALIAGALAILGYLRLFPH